MLVYHLREKYTSLFNEDLRWRNGLPGDLGSVVNRALNAAGGTAGRRPRLRVLDELMKILQQSPIVKRFFEYE